MEPGALAFVGGRHHQHKNGNAHAVPLNQTAAWKRTYNNLTLKVHKMKTAKVVAERIFFPYRPFVDSARYFCEEMKRKEHVSWHDLLAATTLLALSVEAIVNTIGELVVPDFGDFESSSPRAKIRLICQSGNIAFDKSADPFCDIWLLLKIRNQLAHPKFKTLRYESEEMPIKDAQKHMRELGELLHGVEKALSPELAQRFLVAVLKLVTVLKTVSAQQTHLELNSRISQDRVHVTHRAHHAQRLRPGQVSGPTHPPYLHSRVQS